MRILLFLLFLQPHPLGIHALLQHLNLEGRGRRFQAESRSVGDYVGGIHGGKYQFDTWYSGTTNVNVPPWVDSGTTRGSGSSRKILAKVADSAIPSWATRVVDVESPAALRGTISLGEHNVGVSQGVAVTIKNDEISWEPFFATFEILEQRTSESNGITTWVGVTPESGSLAPRGGANNACDGTRPYSDSCHFTVYWKDDCPNVAGNEVMYLVVRTETEHCSWRIDITQ